MTPPRKHSRKDENLPCFPVISTTALHRRAEAAMTRKLEIARQTARTHEPIFPPLWRAVRPEPVARQIPRRTTASATEPTKNEVIILQHVIIPPEGSPELPRENIKPPQDPESENRNPIAESTPPDQLTPGWTRDRLAEYAASNPLQTTWTPDAIAAAQSLRRPGYSGNKKFRLRTRDGKTVRIWLHSEELGKNITGQI